MIEIERVRKQLAEPHGMRFMERVLTPAERERSRLRESRRAEFVAGRFAAKEAVAKALGCGIGRAVGFQDIEVLPDPSGKPVCRLSAAAWERLAFEHPVRIHVSITHSLTMAGAHAVAERLDSEASQGKR